MLHLEGSTPSLQCLPLAFRRVVPAVAQEGIDVLQGAAGGQGLELRVGLRACHVLPGQLVSGDVAAGLLSQLHHLLLGAVPQEGGDARGRGEGPRGGDQLEVRPAPEVARGQEHAHANSIDPMRQRAQDDGHVHILSLRDLDCHRREKYCEVGGSLRQMQGRQADPHPCGGGPRGHAQAPGEVWKLPEVHDDVQRGHCPDREGA
mmetsp:Transcript_102086/g.243464  ORF Transcript_102086/g.243464 Transcript_102086/m.243464 type:complete len:204 (+) Transcript_102086:459-1070(+)